MVKPLPRTRKMLASASDFLKPRRLRRRQSTEWADRKSSLRSVANRIGRVPRWRPVPTNSERDIGRTTDVGAEPSSDRKLMLGLFAMLFASYAYFYQAGGWNENSRMDLIRAIVDDHTLAIDRYHFNTGDKARVGEHFYSDKAPGTSFLGAPVYALLTLFRGLFSDEHHFVVFSSWIVTVVVVGGATALTGSVLFWLCRRLGASQRGALMAAAAYGLGTIAFPLSTMLFSHQVAATALFGAFSLLVLERERHVPKRSVAAGLLAAAAVGIEFPTAPVILVLLAYHVSGPERRSRATTFLGGAFVPAVVMVAYLFLAFDSPLRLGYGVLANPIARSSMHAHGLFGVTYPKPEVVLELVYGRFRGLLPYSPVLVLAVAGFFRNPHRRERLAAVSVVVYYFLFVASYEWWEGGSSFGSRHIAPMLPFLCFPLGWTLDRWPRLGATLAVVSIGVMTVVTAVQPKPNDQLRDPFFGAIWPSFVEGKLARGNVCPYTGRAGEAGHRAFVRGAPHDSFNVGMLLGGRGKRTLTPLIALWIASIYGFWQVISRKSGE
jgi:hypothetical protein